MARVFKKKMWFLFVLFCWISTEMMESEWHGKAKDRATLDIIMTLGLELQTLDDVNL
jgi:hypothetical protein